MTVHVLIVDDDAGVRYTLRGMLEDAHYDVDEAADGAAALERLSAGGIDILISDLRMPRMDGMELLRRTRELVPAPPLIVITAHGSERHAVETMKLGALDYFRKPFDVDEVLAVVRRAAERSSLQRENEALHGEVNLLKSLIFTSRAMSQLALMVRRVGPRDVTVLITGESGSGKERIAEALVRASKRAEKPFVRFNCAAISPELVEAELFGHARGAFTGAIRARTGLFREAEGGTLLLDEVGELDASVQAKLLRVLQEREVRPVGEDRTFAVDVRIVAATHRDLDQLVRDGKFREDLLYRLRVVSLRVPPLRERPEDIPILTRHFLERLSERFGTGPIAVTPALLARLAAHPWPGNVRELENSLESCVALSADGVLDLSLLPGGAAGDVGAPPRAGLRERMAAYERGLIVAALDAARGNRTEAARALDVGRATLHDKMRKHGLIANDPGSDDEAIEH